jgi:uncharacterized membrane protein YphA (DoxX/SURF4 family)
MKKLWAFTKRAAKSEYLAFVLRLFIGIMFIYASTTKIAYPAEFAKNVEAFRLAPYWLVNPVAVLLPWLELICGLFLVIGLSTRTAAVVVGALLAAFTVGIAINVMRDAPISCGCFDSVGEEISWWYVLRDSILVLLTVQIYYFDRIFLLRRGGFLARKRR